VAAHLTQRLDEALGGGRLDRQLWASSSTFLPGDAAKVLDITNKAINNGIADAINTGIIGVGGPPDLAEAVSGVGAELVLAPISKPFGEAKVIIEIIGMGIAILTMQPSLALACAKAISHAEITRVIERSIVDALSTSSAVSKVDTGKGEAKAVGPAVEAISNNSEAANAASEAGRVEDSEEAMASTHHRRQAERLKKQLVRAGLIGVEPSEEQEDLPPKDILSKTVEPGQSRSSLLSPHDEPPTTGIDGLTAI
jgi:hypothetical protein